MDIDTRPFRASVALRRKAVSRRRLEREYRRVLHGVYIRNRVTMTPLMRALAVWEWSRGHVVLSGISAAAVLGAGYLGDHAHASCISRTPRGGAHWVRVHQDRLAPNDIRRVRGMNITSPERTAFDVARRIPYPKNVEVIDQIYQATSLTRAQLADYAAHRPGHHGIRNIPQAIEDSDEGAESVWETRARLAVVRAGLPRPQTQVEIRWPSGEFIARVDMLWPEYRVVFEYDGDGPHSTTAQRDRDIERWNELGEAGYAVVRVRAPHLHVPHPSMLEPRVLRQLRRELRAAGADV